MHQLKMSILFFVTLLSSLCFSFADLQVGFYASSCPQAESTVQAVVAKYFAVDPSVAAAFLRMHFHDCFVRGCDASILIAPTKKKKSERSAGPNLTVRGFEIVDEAKSNIEALCPSTVSCADIITLATRDAVALAGGPSYDVPTGRRDGLVSNPNDVNLPGPSLSISQALQFFTKKGFTLEDMAVLLGGHTVGVAHCTFFRHRLNGDPMLDPALAAKLRKSCGRRPRPLKKDPTAFLDQNTSFVVDNSYYNQILMNRGVMQIDQELALDNSTSAIVADLGSDSSGFMEKFADALVRMGSVEVLVGSAGEIRKICSKFNKPSLKS
ncbi:peroxidase 44-like [Typha angustifolia]|uniref:peroxidase 44-like n=1 Tax=Typha angustifolia TaxID=59011 RepID=UPI003C2B4459